MKKARLYYCAIKEGNFGDDLNLFLWPKLLEEVVDVEKPVFMGRETSVNQDDILFLGIGTLINDKVPTDCKKVVFGAGVGYGRMPEIDDDWTIYFLRGPESAKKLNLNVQHYGIIDAAYAIRLIDGIAPVFDKHYEVSFIPHHNAASSRILEKLVTACGINYINPRDGVEYVISEISRTGLLLTEALHGAIVADALRVPWVPLKLRGDVYEKKWIDFCRSINVSYRPYVFSGYGDSIYNPVGLLSRRLRLLANYFEIKRLKKSCKPILSNDKLCKSITVTLAENIEQINEDFIAQYML